MNTIVDESGNIIFPENQEFEVEIPIEANNKNEPASIVQRSRIGEGHYDRQKFLEIIKDMSESEFCKFCIDIKRLQQFADKFTELSATCPSNVPDEEKKVYWELKHPLGNYEDVQYSDEHQPSEEVYQRLKERVRKFVEIQPGYSNQRITTEWIDEAIFVVYGINMPEGIVGIGKTPEAAYRDFVRVWIWDRGEEYFNQED